MAILLNVSEFSLFSEEKVRSRCTMKFAYIHIKHHIIWRHFTLYNFWAKNEIDRNLRNH